MKFMCLVGSLDRRQMCFGPVICITPAVTDPSRSINPDVTGSSARSIIPAVTGSASVILWLYLPRILPTCLYGVYLFETGLGSGFISYCRSSNHQGAR